MNRLSTRLGSKGCFSYFVVAAAVDVATVVVAAAVMLFLLVFFSFGRCCFCFCGYFFQDCFCQLVFVFVTTMVVVNIVVAFFVPFPIHVE